MEAPRDFPCGGVTIDRHPLDVALGPARVIHIPDAVSITREELQRHSIQSGERILFRTANSDRQRTGSFSENYVCLEREAAAYLATCGVLVVGIDGPSVGGPHSNGPETHGELLDAGVWVMVNLDLSSLDPGEYEFVCLPLRANKGRRLVRAHRMQSE